jgi:hypothetical protein
MRNQALVLILLLECNNAEFLKESYDPSYWEQNRLPGRKKTPLKFSLKFAELSTM